MPTPKKSPQNQKKPNKPPKPNLKTPDDITGNPNPLPLPIMNRRVLWVELACLWKHMQYSIPPLALEMVQSIISALNCTPMA